MAVRHFDIKKHRFRGEQDSSSFLFNLFKILIAAEQNYNCLFQVSLR